MKTFLLFTLLLTLCITSCKEKPIESTRPPIASNSQQNKVDPIFNKVSSDSSNLNFSNDITANVEDMNNLFNYDYFYNGAGVGLEDINNDGLLDIFFCGNQVPNKLFLNKGNLVFEDISETSNINKGKNWSNGVTFVDINNDGWMDIFVSQGGPHQRQQRKNLLFLNLQNGSFEEKAEQYGLADMGISTQSVFFDFDKDGDLDCLVMNESELYGTDPINLLRLTKENPNLSYYSSSHLYQNNKGKFEDITKRAGIEQPIFGLGLSVSDFNDDGWLDFYIASDYYIPDALFLNNQNGTFTDRIKEFTNHISFYGMGMDVADINNDLKQDIFVLDMAANDHVRAKTLMASMNVNRFKFLVEDAKFHHQYMYNSLQLNVGDNKYSNISHAVNMASTDWSWSVLMSDFDHDQDKDIYVTNGYRRYALDNDLQRKVYESKVKYRGAVPINIKKSLYDQMPSEKLPNILFENEKNLNFKEKSILWGLADYSFSNGSAVGDLDNDGDLDLVVNNMDENCFLYQNSTSDKGLGNYLNVRLNGKLSEAYPRVTIHYDNKSQMVEPRRVRGYRSSNEYSGHFGLGKYKNIDTVEVLWPSGFYEEKLNVSANRSLVFNENNAIRKKTNKAIPNQYLQKIESQNVLLAYKHKENPYDDFEKEILLPYKQSTLGPRVSVGDINGDQLEDLFIGGSSGQEGQLFVQNSKGKFDRFPSSALNQDRGFEDADSVFFDFDNDNDLDLFVVSGGNEFEQHSSYYTDRLYLNDGNGKFSRIQSKALAVFPQSGKSVDVIDYDKDGDLDIIVGNRIIPKNYPNFAPSAIFENNNGELINVTSQVSKDLLKFGIINDVLVTDFNQDGWLDFIAVGEWTSIGFFKNNQGKFELSATETTGIKDKGWWYSIAETDVNGDGLKDYVVGNIGLNIKFKASEENHLKIFSSDFDKNGSLDIVLSENYNGEYVPVRGRECSSQQMPFIKSKFTTYSEFANASLKDIYGDDLNSAYQNEATTFESLVLINNGDLTFTKNVLPINAQLFPILKIISRDFNSDGFSDLIIGGNIYNMEVETPRLDAFSGLVLLSNGKDNFTAVTSQESGLLIDGNLKDLEWLKTKKETLLVIAKNNDNLEIYKVKD